MKIVNHSVFDAGTQTIVNTVNCVGVMGKGLAFEVERKFPRVYEDYVRACKEGRIRIGKLQLNKTYRVWVLNFPTKVHWRGKSSIKYIEEGLIAFASNYRKWGIKSVAFPKLGCGHGGLHWKTVEPVMRKHLARLKGVSILMCLGQSREQPATKPKLSKKRRASIGPQLAIQWPSSQTKE